MLSFILPTPSTTSACVHARSLSPRRPPGHKLSPRCNLQQYEPPSSNSHEESLHWKDRVALYAQISAEETLNALLHALRENARSGPRKDDGIDALYAFANLDIWGLTHRFFGKKMDLGQFERFKRVVVTTPYSVLLREHCERTLSSVHVSREVYISRRAFEVGDVETVFMFTMSRAAFGGESGRAWMIDSIIHEAAVHEDARHG